MGHQFINGQSLNLPMRPKIKMKEVPFFENIAVLMVPTTLLHLSQLPKQNFGSSFSLTPSQAIDIIASSREFVPGGESSYIESDPKIQYNVQVHLRFCALDTTDDQEDLFPQSLMVKVNGQNVPFPHPIPNNHPGVEPKRPSKPLNITNNVKCSPTTPIFIEVSWVAEAQRNYAMSVYLVRPLTADDLFQRLKKKNIQPADFTRGRIKEIFEEDEGLAPTSIRVSVACPLRKSRMSYPCRGINCKHLQCFDANVFLIMNEKKPTFICPVCNKCLTFDDLTIDGYFMEVIKTLSNNSGNDIILYADGSWQPVKGTTSNLIELDNDDSCVIVDEEIPAPGGSSHNNNSKPPAAEPEVIEILDSSDEDDDTTRGIIANSYPQQEPATQERQEVESGASASPAQEDNNNVAMVWEGRLRPRNCPVNYAEGARKNSNRGAIGRGRGTGSVV